MPANPSPCIIFCSLLLLHVNIYNRYPNCASAFILWSTPASVAFVLTIFAIIAHLVVEPRARRAHDSKLLVEIVLVLLFILWCSASISGAGSNVTEALVAFVFVGICAVGGLVFYASKDTFGEHEKERILNVDRHLDEKYGRQNADIGRGLLVVTSAPLLGIYFVLSSINQKMRKLKVIPIKPLTENETESMFTAIGAKIFRDLKNWRWTTILFYGIYWGIFFL